MHLRLHDLHNETFVDVEVDGHPPHPRLVRRGEEVFELFHIAAGVEPPIANYLCVRSTKLPE